MKQLTSLCILWAIWTLILYFYYIWYPFHSEVKDFYFFLYLFFVWVLYGSYKFLQSLRGDKNIEIKYSYLLYGFLAQYLLVCVYFFFVSWSNPWLWVFLFFKSIIYIIGSAFIWISFYCFWSRLLSLHPSTHIEDSNVKILTSIWVWFIGSIFLLFLLLSLWLYNLSSAFFVLLWILVVSYPQWKQTLRYFLYTQLSFKRKTWELFWNTSLVINEFLYVIITFLLSVNFLSVFRPFPIGWDDLWAYMNVPKLLSWAGEHIAIGKTYFWEIYTGLGFLAGSQTFAFYLNSFSWVIAVIVIYLCINTFTKSAKQKYDFWLLASTIFVMMPMVIFQIAKDMKIDIWLFSLSVIAISLFYYLIFSLQKKSYILYCILGIIIGVCFAIKGTSLLLLLWIISVIFYSSFGIWGLLSFLLLFFWSFSLANIWGLMNIVVSSNLSLVQWLWFMSFICWLGVLLYLFISKIKQSKDGVNYRFFIDIFCIIWGFVIALSPWIVKHISEIPPEQKPHVLFMLWGFPDAYKPDYSEIYSPEELEAISSSIDIWINSSWTTANEDFWRYFWYEKWVNNYLKLPWNLTFQTNQKWEFTDITFLFLTLIPWLFLFLPYRKEAYKYPVIWVIFLTLLYFIPSPISVFVTSLLSQIKLPMWYAFIIWIFSIPIIYFSWALDRKNKITKIFLITLCFITVYMWLWAISSYGVVWYWIVMYFMLFVLIFLCISSTKDDSESYAYVSYTVLAFVIIYALQSSIPHGITNIKSSGYSEYKMWYFNEEVSLMSYHPEYFPIMFELNISDNAKQELFIEYRKQLLLTLSTTQDFEQILPQIQAYQSMDELHRLIVELSRVDFPEWNINSEIQNIRQNLYELVIYTPDEIKSNSNIYRVGTFLKYFISDNDTRLFWDSLLTSFDNYIDSQEQDIILNRFKKLNLEYILLDLNAATIDRDPEKNLTKRYERLINFLKSPDVELIETDSICLRVGLDNYKLESNLETYMWLATTNHSSQFSQIQKKNACLSVIQKIISNEDLISSYPYLNSYKNALIQAEIDVNNKDVAVNALAQLIRWNWFKALFKIK